MRTLEWILFSIIVGLSITGALADPDLWWHVTIGRWIVGHGALPTTELWNRFGFGHPFTPYSWSFEIIVALLEKLGGLKALLIAQMLLVAVTANLMAWCLSQAAKDYFFGMLIGAVVTSGFVAQFTLRPQSVVWLFFALLLWVCFQIRTHGVSSKRLLALSAIMMAWANMHITTVIGVVTIVVLLFDPRDRRRWILPLSLVIIATCCTPHLGYEWVIFFSKADHPLALRSIAEFGPGTVLDYPVGLLIGLLALLLTFLACAPRSVPAALLVLVGAFTLGGLAVVKFLPFALVSTGYAVCLAWYNVQKTVRSEPIQNLFEGFERLRRGIAHCSGTGLLFFLLCVIVVKVHNLLNHSPVLTESVPEDAVDFMIAHQLPKPLMNTFGDGGYVMYRLSSETGELTPEERVNIDGRTNVNDPAIMELNQRALDGRLSWRRYLDRVNPRTILWRNRSPLTTILLASGEWCRVFAIGSQESGHSVFIRTEEAGSEGLPSCLPEGASRQVRERSA